MAGSFQVITAALTNHARTLSGLAGELRGAHDAARGVTMTGEAYGQTCQRFAATIDTIAQAGQETLLSGVEALEAEVMHLRDTVRDYENRDAAGAARIERAGGERR
jgi:hypothetical protein